MPNSTISRSLALGVNSDEGLELLENPIMIKITVGQDEAVSWILPKSLLTHHSTFFNVALNGTFAESSSRSITMPDDSPEVFRRFVQWLYVGDIMKANIDEWLGAWIFGDKIGSIGFQDCAMTKLVKHHVEAIISPTTAASAYRRSVSGSKLRKWALEQLLYDSSLGGILGADWESMVVTKTELAVDIAIGLIRNAGGDFGAPHAHLESYLGN